MAFFPGFSRKNGCSHTHILSKIRLFSKKQTALKSMFKKNVHPLTKTVLSRHFFFQVFYEKPYAVRSIFGEKKRQFCKNYNIFWVQKVNRMPFFLIFHRKIIALIPIFCQRKIVHALKNTYSFAHILTKKHLFSQNQIAHIIIIKFFM